MKPLKLVLRSEEHTSELGLKKLNPGGKLTNIVPWLNIGKKGLNMCRSLMVFTSREVVCLIFLTTR